MDSNNIHLYFIYIFFSLALTHLFLTVISCSQQDICWEFWPGDSKYGFRGVISKIVHFSIVLIIQERVKDRFRKLRGRV